MIRVLLVDDHELVRTGFRHILAGSHQVEVVGEAKNGEEALALSQIDQPGSGIDGCQYAGYPGGIEATRKIKRLYPSVQIIVVTVAPIPPFLSSCTMPARWVMSQKRLPCGRVVRSDPFRS